MHTYVPQFLTPDAIRSCFCLFQAKFVELMCIRSESAEATESAVDAVVQVVKELVRKFA
jgi:hypothetical protein